MRNMRVSHVIAELERVRAKYGDLPIGGDDTNGVDITVCDEDGHDAESGADYCGPAHDVYVEAW